MSAPTAPVRHLTLAEVLDLARHACLAQDQPVELRAPGLLESAVHRPRAQGAPPSGSWGSSGTPAYEDPYEQAAALLHGIATNHPLVDGNKRTAWLAAATFLAVNGADPGDADQEAAYALVIDVAAGHESDVARIAARLRALLAPPM
ncbi:type II toxin-antitoxin system death-on-curing family toxin [Streptomyces sp. NPDC058682]|uniref:type II toxin-antitoxin system death-on-curing family toxin n=1 Tax=unclassified Streptomyces TaxID=2593676 RepID=UPI00225B0BFB|nr:type II toxin-antitoxin system death-on-curing family toxin [Streptomyces sp. NBC_01214]MCX4801255.1 type II toxin-antitoxin system death-on-curing family toxin [Streptomyces sp. NBC_01214]